MECKLKIVPSYHRRILDLEGLLESKEPITLILQRTKLRLKGINEEYFFLSFPLWYVLSLQCHSEVMEGETKNRSQIDQNKFSSPAINNPFPLTNAAFLGSIQGR